MKRNLFKSLVFITTILLFVFSLSIVKIAAHEENEIFSDVKKSDWFYEYVVEAYNFGFINGRTDVTFCPDQNLTYAEAIKLASVMFINIMKLDITLSNGNVWYAPYVDFAKKYNIITGDYPDYNANIAREEFVNIFYNSIQTQNLFEYIDVPDNTLPDVSTESKYSFEIYSFYRAGILTGSDENKTFKPQSNIVRSEVAAILMRIFYMNTSEMEDDIDNEFDIDIAPPATSQPYDEYVNFSLNGMFDETILKETQRAPQDYLDSTYYIGDSLTLGLRAFRILPQEKVFAAGSIDPSHALQDELIILPDSSKVTIPNACAYYKPERVVITLGTNSVSWRTEDDFISLYSALINEILTQSPQTKIIVQSIPPVSEAYEAKGGKITNGVINRFNISLAKMCANMGLPFLNTAEVLKNERGYLNDNYQSGDGLHQNQSAYKVWLDYLMTHEY